MSWGKNIAIDQIVSALKSFKAESEQFDDEMEEKDDFDDEIENDHD